MLNIFLVDRLLSLLAFSLILAWLSLPPPGDPQSGRVLSVIFVSQSYLGPREWSPLARWTFREFNEVKEGVPRAGRTVAFRIASVGAACTTAVRRRCTWTAAAEPMCLFLPCELLKCVLQRCVVQEVWRGGLHVVFAADAARRPRVEAGLGYGLRPDCSRQQPHLLHLFFCCPVAPSFRPPKVCQ